MTPTGKILVCVLLFGLVICVLAEAEGKYQYKRKYHRKGNHTKSFKQIFGEERTDVPDFCNKKSCPKFKVLENTTDYEVRYYEASNWIAVNKTSFDGNRRRMFRTAFNYLKGNNSANQTVIMGIPVLKKMIPSENFPENIMIYLSTPNPPQPNNPALYFVSFPAQKVFVRVFGGYARPDIIKENRQKLIDAVGEDQVNTNLHYVGSFNPPWVTENRHNELWMLPKN